MSDEHPPVSPDRVPTLTEVLEFGNTDAALQVPPEPGPAAPSHGADEVVESTAALVMPAPQAPPAPASEAEPEPQAAQAVASILEPQAAAAAEAAPVADTPVAATLPEPVAEPSAAVVPVAFDAETLVAHVLAELQPRIDMLLESRLREALAPALARVADGLIRETRDELSAALRELVSDAVTRAQQRRNERR